MDSNEINVLVQKLCIRNFLGVFAVDELHQIPKDCEGVFIFNTDPSYKSGQHWISVCVSRNHLFYFDPLASFENVTNEIQTFSKRYDKHLIFNDIRIQSYDSNKCGAHCLVFCFIMSIKPTSRTYTKYLKSFVSYTVEEREHLSLTYFSILGTHKIGNS